MKKTVFALALLASTSGLAYAADMPFSTGGNYSSAYSYSAPAFTWNGVYAGANAGYAFMGNSNYDVSANDVVTQTAIDLGSPSRARARTNGFAGGLQVGYNFQVGNTMDPFFGTLSGVASGIVIGIEGDADYTAQKGGNDYATPDGDVNFRSHTDYVGTVRGRLGYAIDRFLVFGTGGFAYAGVRDKATYTNAAFGATSYAGGTDKFRTGYAYGGGVEYALPTISLLSFMGSGTVTLKAEYLHYDLGTSNFVANGAVGSYNVRVKNDGNIARAGVNYKFNPFGY